MKKVFKVLILSGIVAFFGIMPTNVLEVQAATNNVPAYYYANYKFIDDRNQIWDLFNTIKARKDLELDIDRSMFSELYTHFVQFCMAFSVKLFLAHP